GSRLEKWPPYCHCIASLSNAVEVFKCLASRLGLHGVFDAWISTQRYVFERSRMQVVIVGQGLFQPFQQLHTVWSQGCMYLQPDITNPLPFINRNLRSLWVRSDGGRRKGIDGKLMRRIGVFF